MPTYDYKCNSCGHRFELFQSIKAPHERKCPKCGKNALERLIGTGGAIIFKGSGFYQTDYRSEAYKKSAEADKPSEAKPATETKTETKAEAKADAKPDSKPDPRSDKKPDAKPSPKPDVKPDTAPTPERRVASKTAAKASNRGGKSAAPAKAKKPKGKR